MKFCTRVRLKPSNDRGEFEIDRAISKNNIAENSVALGHETHNRFFCHYFDTIRGSYMYICTCKDTSTSFPIVFLITINDKLELNS